MSHVALIEGYEIGSIGGYEIGSIEGYEILNVAHEITKSPRASGRKVMPQESSHLVYVRTTSLKFIVKFKIHSF